MIRMKKVKIGKAEEINEVIEEIEDKFTELENKLKKMDETLIEFIGELRLHELKDEKTVHNMQKRD